MRILGPESLKVPSLGSSMEGESDLKMYPSEVGIFDKTGKDSSTLVSAEMKVEGKERQ